MEERGHEVTLAGRDAPERPEVAAAELVCVAVPSRAFREVTASLPGDAPVIILTKGLDPETGKRLSQVVEGREALVLSGPNHAEEIAQGLPAAAVLASDERGARHRAPARDPLAPLSRVREHRPRRSRALRGGEERDRPCRRRRRRPRGWRQREGRAHHARPCGDGSPGRGVRGSRGDVLRHGRDGRSDGHLLEPPRP